MDINIENIVEGEDFNIGFSSLGMKTTSSMPIMKNDIGLDAFADFFVVENRAFLESSIKANFSAYAIEIVYYILEVSCVQDFNKSEVLRKCYNEISKKREEIISKIFKKIKNEKFLTEISQEKFTIDYLKTIVKRVCDKMFIESLIKQTMRSVAGKNKYRNAKQIVEKMEAMKS